MCSEVEAHNFIALVHSFLLNNGKNVLKMKQILWKNWLTIAKNEWIIHVNFVVTAITFSEKETGGITFILPVIYEHYNE
jgi:hypothetical protein